MQRDLLDPSGLYRVFERFCINFPGRLQETTNVGT